MIQGFTDTEMRTYNFLVNNGLSPNEARLTIITNRVWNRV